MKMTLHEAMIKVLKENGGFMTFNALADEIYRQDLYKQRAGTKAPYSQIRLRAKNYGQYFTIEEKGVKLLHNQ
ncbi:MAG: hypothetical protein J6X31_07470 [Bacteroidales bacterium]|nr:hypothetical protein [Bacteroidales bacterium]